MYVKLFLAKEFDLALRHIHWHKSSCFRTSRETDEQCFWCGDDFITTFMTTLNILSAARMVKDIFWLRWRYKRWWTFMSIDGHEFKKFQSINWCMYCMYNTMDSSKMSWKDFKDLMIFVLSSNFSSPWKPQKSYHTAPPLLGRGGHRRPCRSGRRWMRNPGAAGWGSANHHTMVFFLQRLIKEMIRANPSPKKIIRTCRCFFLQVRVEVFFYVFLLRGAGGWAGSGWFLGGVPSEVLRVRHLNVFDNFNIFAAWSCHRTDFRDSHVRMIYWMSHVNTF